VCLSISDVLFVRVLAISVELAIHSFLIYLNLFASKVVTSYIYGDSIHTHYYAEFFVLQRRVCMFTEFLSLALKHLNVHSCGALCTTAVRDFYCYTSGAAGSSPSPSYMAVSRRCFLSVRVLWCKLESLPVPVVM
jgi:hypothetical protein